MGWTSCLCVMGEETRGRVRVHLHVGTCMHVQASFVCVCALGLWVAWCICVCNRGCPMCSWVHRFARAGMGDTYVGRVMAQSRQRLCHCSTCAWCMQACRSISLHEPTHRVRPAFSRGACPQVVGRCVHLMRMPRGCCTCRAKGHTVTSMDADLNMYPILIPPVSNTFHFCHHPQPHHSQPHHAQSIIYHPSFIINGNS